MTKHLFLKCVLAAAGLSVGLILFFSLDSMDFRDFLAQVTAPKYQGIPADFNFQKNLQYGDFSLDVGYLQFFLAREGFFCQKCRVTGFFGRATWLAVKAFQQKYGIKATAYVGGITRTKINQLLTSDRPANSPSPSVPPSPSSSATPSPSASPPAFDFTLTLSPTANSFVQGSLASVSVSAASSRSYPVSFTASGQPSGSIVSFSSTTCYLSCSTVMFISLPGSAPAGNYSVVVNATANNLAKNSTFSLTVTPTVAAPRVTSLAASLIQINQAQLNASLTSLGGSSLASVWFDWGLSIAYGNSTTAKEKTSSDSFSETITGLTPGTSYHFRAVAQTASGGWTYGTDQNFATLPAPIIDLKANSFDGPITINYNTSANLSWSSTNVTTCTASGDWSGSKAVSGTENTGSLTSSKTYLLSCSGSAGSAQDTVTVNVNPPAASPVPVPVLALKYFPDQNSDGHIDQETADTNETVANMRTYTERISGQLVSALNFGSKYHGYKNTNAVASLNYSIYETKEFIRPVPRENSNPLVASPADHVTILNGLNICNYVENLGVKEVWIWMYHTSTTYPVESYQRGPGHAFGNGYMNLPLCNKSYTVYDYNYTRGLGEALEDHTHHIERILAYADNNIYWNLFTAGSTEFLQNNKTNYYDNLNAVYRCGWTHCPPNVIIADCSGSENQSLNRCTCLGYDWINERSVLSDCENWQPESYGTTQNVSCNTWKDVYINPDRVNIPGRSCPDDGGVAFKVWWLQNIPGKDNGLTYQGKTLRNWWDFIGNFDGAIQVGRNLAR